MQRRRACGAAELAGASASSAVGMASLAELCQGIIVLRAQALHAQSAFQHRVRRTGSAFQRAFSFARATIMMTLLTTEIGFKETFWAFGMAFAGCQLPASRTGDALIPPGSQARFTRQVTLGALTSVAVITWRTGRSAFSALQLQPILTRRAVQTGDATLTGVQTRDANRPRGLYHGVIRVVALGHAALALKQQRVRAGYAVIFRGAGAGFAGRVTDLALAVLVVLARVAVAATLGRAQTLLVQAPALDAAGAT